MERQALGFIICSTNDKYLRASDITSPKQVFRGLKAEIRIIAGEEKENSVVDGFEQGTGRD